MLEVMHHFHQYVPSVIGVRPPCTLSNGSTAVVPTAYFHKLLLGGDQLTVARARAAKKERTNYASPSLGFNGLIPCAEDWHTQTILLQVCLCV